MFSRLGPAVLTVILFNLLPIIGVAFYHWSPFDMFWLFWLETLVIALFNTIRVLFSQGLPPGQPLPGGKLRFKLGAACKYLLVRIGIFLFYSLFIIVFIGLMAGKKDPIRMAQTLGLRNLLFNLALLLSAITQAYYLLRHFFGTGAYLHARPSDFPAIFDGRQIVIHVAVVLGAVGAAFLFEKNGQQEFAALWVISVFCVAKCFFELYLLRRESTTLQGQTAW